MERGEFLFVRKFFLSQDFRFLYKGDLSRRLLGI
jgi:hypothetical protein